MKFQLVCFLFLFTIYTLPAQSQTEIFDELQENVWYLPTKDKQARLYITEIGKGDTIIALHGGPGNDFHYLVDALRNHRHSNRFVLFDQRGSLMSPVKDSLVSHLSLDILVEDLEHLRKTLQLNKITLFGHSFGSLLAISYTIKYPQHVKGLILTATMPPYFDEKKTFPDYLKTIHSRVKTMRKRPEIQEILKREGMEIDSLLTAKQLSDKQKIVGNASFNMINLKNWRNFKGGGVYYNFKVDGAIGATIPAIYDIRTSLDSFPIPISILQGDQDYIDPHASQWDEILKKYPLVKRFVFKESSHYIWLDHQKEFDRILDQELKRMKTL